MDQDPIKQNGGVSDHNNDLFQRKRHAEVVKAEAVQSHQNGGKDATTVEKKRPQAARFERKKIFQHRNALLDDLMEEKHLRSVYNMFLAALSVIVIFYIAADIADHGRIILDCELFCFAFGQPGTVAWAWICMFAYTVLVPFYALQFWGSLYPRSKHKVLLSVTVGTLLLVGQVFVLGVFPIYVVKHYQLPPASCYIVTLEQIRMVMKSYSLVREGVPTVLQKGNKDVQLPQLSSYLYFLFCPTCIYRDSYPRTPSIRWKFVFKNFAEFFGCLFFINCTMVYLGFPWFANNAKEPFSAKLLVGSLFQATLSGTLILLLAFYGFLHSWQNAFAEMLRFGDRMFYKDWWTSTSFSNYFRTWNVIVHDWLFYYVYQDLLWLLNRRFRSLGMMAVFLMSAGVHEYAMTMSLGFFYPVLFCLFAVLGVLFNFIINDKRTSPVYNVILWAFLIFGQGIEVCLYCQEWYARIHCPPTGKTFWGFEVPRSWSCHS